MKIPFDPLTRSKEVESLVMKGKRRKYYRFRKARFYGGIITGDAVGCNLLCAYCWNYERNLDPLSAHGFYFTPEEVVQNFRSSLLGGAIRRVRISGAEPILGESSFFHLSEVIKLLSSAISDFDFILETNGIVLGTDPHLSKVLSQFRNLFVRVSIKGFNEESFEKITGAKGESFWLQIQALINLWQARVFAWPCIMSEIFDKKSIEILEDTLKKFGCKGEIEFEYLHRYPFVMENLKKRGIVDIKS